MPRPRVKYKRTPRAFPSDFPQRLKRFQEESQLPWAEIARRLGVDPETVRRWREGRVRPNAEHLLGLHCLADEFGLGWLFRD